MRGTGFAAAALAVVLAGCGNVSPEQEREESARLRASFEKFRTEHLASIETENRLIAATLAWLDGTAVTAPRSQAVSEARAFMDRWARVYFVPRHMHEQLRYEHYDSPAVKAVQRELLDGMKRRYFELHDYQRYAQAASETEMHRTPPGHLARTLQEFRRRLHTRGAASDEIGPVLETLPRAGV